MLKIKNKYGITLISLIITIVVLLILAVVVMNVVTKEGITEQLTGARKEYQIAQEKEEIELLQNSWALNKYMNPGQTFEQFMQSKLSETEKVTSTEVDEYGVLTVTMKSGNQFKIEENKEPEFIELDDEEEVDNIEELKKYILGADGQGRYLFNEMKIGNDPDAIVTVTGFDEDGNPIFTLLQNPEDPNSTIHQEITIVVDELDEILEYVIENPDEIIIVKYKGEYYYFKYNVDSSNGDISSIAESLFKIHTSTASNHYGKYVKYNGLTYVVINHSKKLEMLSVDSFGSVEIGNRDYDAAIGEYHTAHQKTLRKCMEITGIATEANVRNIKEDDVLPDNITLATGEKYWITGYKSDNNGKNYYLSYVDTNGEIKWELIAEAVRPHEWDPEDFYGYSGTYGVRPVIILPVNALEGAQGDGLTEDTAFILNY